MPQSKPRRRPGEDEVLELGSDWLNKNLDEDLAVLRDTSSSLPLGPKLRAMAQQRSEAMALIAQTTVVAVSAMPVAAKSDEGHAVRPETAVVTDPEAAASGSGVAVVVQAEGSVVSDDLWRAQEIGALFPSRRVRRIHHAREALTAAEQSVYDLLLSFDNSQTSAAIRLVRIGYDRIARLAHVTKRNASLIVERLIAKGFLELAAAGDALTARQYRVFQEQSVMQSLERAGRIWVVRSGNGTLFVHRVSAVVSRLNP